MARLTASDPVRAADAIRDHSEILAAVRSGDRRRIRAAIHRHLQTAGAALHGRS
jgi:FCD domain.